MIELLDCFCFMVSTNLSRLPQTQTIQQHTDSTYSKGSIPTQLFVTALGFESRSCRGNLSWYSLPQSNASGLICWWLMPDFCRLPRSEIQSRSSVWNSSHTIPMYPILKRYLNLSSLTWEEPWARRASWEGVSCYLRRCMKLWTMWTISSSFTPKKV